MTIAASSCWTSKLALLAAREPGQCVDVRRQFLRKPDDHLEPPIALEDLFSDAAVKRGSPHILEVSHVQPVAGKRLTIWRNPQNRQAAQFLDPCIGYADLLQECRIRSAEISDLGPRSKICLNLTIHTQ